MNLSHQMLLAGHLGVHIYVQDFNLVLSIVVVEDRYIYLHGVRACPVKIKRNLKFVFIILFNFFLRVKLKG